MTDYGLRDDHAHGEVRPGSGHHRPHTEHRTEPGWAEGQIILAAKVTSDGNDRCQLKPMLDAARANLEAVAFAGKIKAALADGDYWNNEHIKHLRGAEITVVIPTEDRYHKGQREKEPKQGPHAERINKILASAAGNASTDGAR